MTSKFQCELFVSLTVISYYFLYQYGIRIVIKLFSIGFSLCFFSHSVVALMFSDIYQEKIFLTPPSFSFCYRSLLAHNSK